VILDIWPTQKGSKLYSSRRMPDDELIVTTFRRGADWEQVILAAAVKPSGSTDDEARRKYFREYMRRRRAGYQIGAAPTKGCRPKSVGGHLRPALRVSASVRCLLFPESDLLTARQRNDANGMDRPRSRP
jgi:hypothetical protein